MSFQALTWAQQQALPDRPKFVLVTLAHRADERTGRCWPGMKRITEETCIPKRSLIRHIAALERNGFLRVVKTREANGQQSENTYFLSLDRLPTDWGMWRWTAVAPLAEGVDAEDSRVPLVAPGDDLWITGGEGPGAGCHGDRVPGANGGTQYESKRELKENLSSVARSRSVEIPSGFSREDQEAEIVRMGIDGAAKRVGATQFVIKGTRAWDDWMAWRAERGITRMPPVIRRMTPRGERSGWYFPSLFPPADELAGGGGLDTPGQTGA